MKTKKTFQTELKLEPPAEKPVLSAGESVSYCPVYYPKTGEELGKLAAALNPILEKTRWKVHFAIDEDGKGFLELCDRKKEKRSRRLTEGEITAWQALLPELLGIAPVLRGTGPE